MVTLLLTEEDLNSAFNLLQISHDMNMACVSRDLYNEVFLENLKLLKFDDHWSISAFPPLRDLHPYYVTDPPSNWDHMDVTCLVKQVPWTYSLNHLAWFVQVDINGLPWVAVCLSKKRCFNLLVNIVDHWFNRTDVRFHTFSDYDLYLANSCNKRNHCLNGNTKSLFSFHMHCMDKYDVTFEYDADDLKDDNLLTSIIRRTGMSRIEAFKYLCYKAASDYILCPYLFSSKGNLQHNIMRQFYINKMVKFGSIDPKKNYSSSYYFENYIVKRFKWFLRNVTILDHKTHLFVCNEWLCVDLAGCKVSSQMLGSLFDTNKQKELYDRMEQINTVTDRLLGPETDAKLDKVDGIVSKMIAALDIVVNNPIIKMVGTGLEGLGNFLNTMSETLTSICDSIASTLGVSSESPLVKFFFALSFIIVLLSIILTIGSVTSFVCELVRLATGLLFKRTVSIDDSVDSQMCFPLFVDGPVSQMAPNDMLSTLFVMGIYLCTGTKIDSPNFARTAMSWGSILGCMVDNSKSFVNEACKAFNCAPMFMGPGELPEFVEYVTELIEVCYGVNIEQEVTLSQKSADRVIRLYLKLPMFKTALLDPKLIKETNQVVINIALVKLEKLHQLAKTASPEVHDRIEPMLIYLFGPPGQGKSALLKCIPRILYNSIRSDKEFDMAKYSEPWSPSLVYARSVGEAYWSKWNNAPFTLFNEIFSAKEERLREVTASEIIKCVDTAAFPLNAADVENKGMNYMTSDVIMCTSNVIQINDLGISDPGAIVRRLHFPLEMKKIGEFDPKRMNFDSSWVFVAKNFDGTLASNQTLAYEKSGLVPDKSYRFSQIMDLMVKCFKNKLRRMDTINFDEIDWEYIAENGVPSEPIVFPDNLVRLEDSIRLRALPVKPNATSRFNRKYDARHPQWQGKFDPINLPFEPESQMFSFGYSLDVPNEPDNDYLESCERLRFATIAPAINFEPDTVKVSQLKSGNLHVGTGRHKIARLLPCFKCLTSFPINPDVTIDDRITGNLLAALFQDKYWRAVLFTLISESTVGMSTLFLHKVISYVYHMGTSFDKILVRTSGQPDPYICECCARYESEQGHSVEFPYIDKLRVGKTVFLNVRQFEAFALNDEVLYYTSYENGKSVFKLYEFLRNMKVRIDTDPLSDRWKLFSSRVDYKFCKMCEKGETIVQSFVVCVDEFGKSFLKLVEEVTAKIHSIVSDIWDFMIDCVKTICGWCDIKPAFSDHFANYADSEFYVGSCAIPHPLRNCSSYTNGDWLKTFGLAAVICCGIVGIGFGIQAIVDKFSTQPEDNFHPFKDSSDNYDAQSYTSRYKQQINKPRVNYAAGVSSQMSVIDEMKEYENIAFKNSRLLELLDANGRNVNSNIFFVSNTHAVFPKHAFYATTCIGIKVWSVDGATFTHYTPKEYKLIIPEQRDCIFITFNFPTNCGSLLHRLMGSPKKFCTKTIRLMKGAMDGKIRMYYATGGQTEFVETEITAKVRLPDKILATPMSGYYRVKDGGGFDGACAFPVLSKDSSDQNKPILGIHVAQHGADSIVCPIFASDFIVGEQATQSLEIISQMYHSEDPYADQFKEEYSNGMPGVDSYLLPKQTYVGSMSTAFVRSSLSKYLHPSTDNSSPAKLSAFTNAQGDVISPLKKFYSKYLLYESSPMPSVLDDLMYEPDKLWGGFEPKFSFKHRWLTIEEAIFGNPDLGIESMEGNSSAGFYLNKISGMAKRHHWFDILGRTIDPRLRKMVQDRIVQMLKGHKISQVVVDNLKDELRDNVRVAEGKTRVFCVGELVACIVSKMFLGLYMADCKRHRGGGSCSVGTNVHNSDWTFIGREIFRFGRDRVIGGDLPTMDVSTQRFMAHAAFIYLRTRLNLAKAAERVLEALLYNVVTTIHVSGSWSYMHCKGNSSGNWLTSWFNSFCCYTYLSTTFYYLRPRDCEGSFKDNVGIQVYGDDNAGSVREGYEWYNNLTIAAGLLKLFGLSFTDPLKGDITTAWLEKSSQIFLARKFVECDGVYLAPLDKDSLYGMLHWVRHHAELDDDAQLMQNLEVFSSEMSHYDVEEGDAVWKSVMDAVHQSGLVYSGREPAYWRQARFDSAFQTHERM